MGNDIHRGPRGRSKGKIVTKHEISLLSCPECDKMLKVKICNKWEKVGSSHDVVQFVEAACCRIRYRFMDVNRTNGCLRVDIRDKIRRGAGFDYTSIVDALPDAIQLGYW